MIIECLKPSYIIAYHPFHIIPTATFVIENMLENFNKLHAALRFLFCSGNNVCEFYYVIGFSSTIGTIIYACLQVLNSNLLTSSGKILCLFPINQLIMVFVLQIVITGLGAALIDKAGRKPLLLVK